MLLYEYSIILPLYQQLSKNLCVPSIIGNNDQDSAYVSPAPERKLSYNSGSYKAVSYTHLDVYKRQS